MNMISQAWCLSDDICPLNSHCSFFSVTSEEPVLCVLSILAILKALYPFIQLSVYYEALSQVAQAGLKLYVDEDVLELLICPALPPSPKCWDHKHAPGFM